MKGSILVVDDETPLRRTVVQALEQEGYNVREAADGEEALRQLKSFHPELMVLDVKMPGMSGFDLCRRLREAPEWRGIHVIFLTSRGEESQRVLGLELGGDDYIVKPFSIMELTARVKAVLRRGRKEEDVESVLRSGEVSVDVPKHVVTVAGRPVSGMPAKEFELLCALLRRPGRVLSRSVLMESVWGRDYTGTTRTVDTHVYRLRKRLGESGKGIQGVGAFGYKWEGPEGPSGH